MVNEKSLHIAILGENKFESLQIILYSWLRRLRILTIGWGTHSKIMSLFKHAFFIQRFIRKVIKEHSVGIGNYKSLYYELSQETIDLTLEFYTLHINNKFITYYNKILSTKKFEAYIKKSISVQISALLTELHLIRLSNLNREDILIIRNPINKFVVKSIENKYKIKYRIKWIMPLWRLLSLLFYHGWLSIEFIRRGVVFNKSRKEYKLSKESAWAFNRLTLRDDIMIDNIKFKMDDLLLLEFNSKQPQCRNAFKEAQAKGFNNVSVANLKININKNILNIALFYFWVPIKMYFKLFFSRQLYLLYYISSFHKQCFPIEILMNLYDLKCYISTNDRGDVPLTIIFNKYGAKSIIFHWSDLTIWKTHSYAFIAHNIYYVWGDVHYDYHCANYFIDKRVNVGCIFKEAYNKAVRSKSNILNQTSGVGINKRIVTFFDNSFSNDSQFSDNFFLEYLGLIKKFCDANKDISVLLKPKNKPNYEKEIAEVNLDRFRKYWAELKNCNNFIQLDPLRWSIEMVIAISDVCIDMGMNSPSTIGLICGKNALYFDNTGNNYHPFAKKYRNKIVFEDKDLLLRQMENILNGKFNCRDAISERELREYDTFSDDKALERIRDSLYELTLP